MLHRAYKFLGTHKCIYKHSINHALTEITETIRKSLDNGKHACGVFSDLQKEFDTVNHSILLDKLEYYGIRGIGRNGSKHI